MNKVIAIDDFVVERLMQPISNACSYRLNLSRYRVARLLAFVAAPLISTDVTADSSGIHLLLNLVTLASFFLLFIGWLPLLTDCEKRERISRTAVPRYRLVFLWPRMLTGFCYLVAVAFSLVPVVSWFVFGWTFLSAALFVIAIYLPACHAGPPFERPKFPVLARLDGIAA